MLTDLTDRILYTTLGRVVLGVVAVVVVVGALFATGVLGGSDPAGPAAPAVTAPTSTTLPQSAPGTPMVSRDADGRIIISNRAKEAIENSLELPQSCVEATAQISELVDAVGGTQADATVEQAQDFVVLHRIGEEICSYRDFLTFSEAELMDWFGAPPTNTPPGDTPPADEPGE